MLKKFAATTAFTLILAASSASPAMAAFGGKGSQWSPDWTAETVKLSYSKGQLAEVMRDR